MMNELGRCLFFFFLNMAIGIGLGLYFGWQSALNCLIALAYLGKAIEEAYKEGYLNSYLPALKKWWLWVKQRPFTIVLCLLVVYFIYKLLSFLLTPI